MRYLGCFLMLLVLLPGQAVAADRDDQLEVRVRSEQQSVFKGLLYSVWGKLRALSPKPAAPRNRTVATAGIRGAETTTSLIQPYWKDDKTDDPIYIKELTAYARAQQLAEAGDLNGAVKALGKFIDTHKESDLRPNAQFALGISYGGLGRNKDAVVALQSFVNDNPRHPLVVDAKQVISQLK